MKKILLYILFIIVSLFVNALIAFFVLPTWAICDCLYNDVKNIIILVGPIVTAVAIIYLTHRQTKEGMNIYKAFTKSLLLVSSIFFVFNIIKDDNSLNFLYYLAL